jgi:hypothetical protein
VLQHDFRRVRAVADGRATDDVRRVSIRLTLPGVRLAHLEQHDFTGQMLWKIVHP